MPYVYGVFYNHSYIEEEQFGKQTDKFYTDYLVSASNKQKTKRYKKKSKQNIQSELFDFDPNTVTKTDLRKLGFSEKQVAIFVNYRKSGAKFYKPSDLQNIYGISARQYAQLEPYVKIAVKDKPKTVKGNNYVKEQFVSIELNTADTAQLKQLKGIGSVLAARIVKYRNFLGGFYNINQLSEVYGIKPKLISALSGKISVDTSFVHKININTIDFKTLNKHPYLSFADTKAIFKYRELMGNFTNAKQLISNNLINEDTYLKIEPYLELKQEALTENISSVPPQQ